MHVAKVLYTGHNVPTHQGFCHHIVSSNSFYSQQQTSRPTMENQITNYTQRYSVPNAFHFIIQAVSCFCVFRSTKAHHRYMSQNCFANIVCWKRDAKSSIIHRFKQDLVTSYHPHTHCVPPKHLSAQLSNRLHWNRLVCEYVIPNSPNSPPGTLSAYVAIKSQVHTQHIPPP